MIGPVELSAAVALVGLIAYAIFGGADFGGGVWDALATGPRRAAQRRAIAHAMGPVWEANHVWLIFVIVLLFSCFPRAFSRYVDGLFVPLHLALVGITLRGAAFVFKKHAHDFHPRLQDALGVAFSASSVVTPALFGMCLGAVSTGDPSAWTSPLALATGLAAVSLCAYQAAVFLAHATEGELAEDFRRRAIGASICVVLGSLATLPFLAPTAPHLFAGLTHGRGLVVFAAAIVSGAASLGALWTRRFAVARVASSAQVTALLGGWGLAQYPYALYPTLTLREAASPEPTLRFVLWTLPFGLALLAPSLWLLFRVFDARANDSENKG